MTEFSVIVLAAGSGTRMKSKTAKALHTLCGKEMLFYCADAAKTAGARMLSVIAGYDRENVVAALDGEWRCVVQNATLREALLSATEDLPSGEAVIVLPADMPFIMGETLKSAAEYHFGGGFSVTHIAAKEDNEHCGTITVFNCEWLRSVLKCADTAYDENQMPIIDESGDNVGRFYAPVDDELTDINDRACLAAAEKKMQRKINERLMCGGVTIKDPDNTYICADAIIGTDTVIYPGTVIESGCKIGENVFIGHECFLRNAQIGSGSDVNISTVIDSVVGENTHIGPYAYIRPGCAVGSGCKVGDFVELKKAIIGDGTKLSHLTYVGDAEVGENVNFGCGTVVVNYDGKSKYKTVIKDNAFIGCNSNLVSPVTVNEGAYIAAGSTITDEVPEHTLAIARARQVIKHGWSDKRKK